MEKKYDEPLLTRKQREIDRLQKLYKKRPETDDGFRFEGVLLSDAIERCVTAFDLISPFDRNNLKAACYKLTIGDEYAISGKIHSLSDEAEKRTIKIPPFAVAIIKTHETINMPRFLIGRWNIQVSRAYEGLIWVGGPQVDAGYVGNLFCPIYNLSDQVVTLSKGSPIAVIDFVPTTQFHPGRSAAYKFPPDRVLFEEYKPEQLVSGLVTGAQKRLDGVEQLLRTSIQKSETDINTIRQRVENFLSLTLAMVAVLFAAITVSSMGAQTTSWHYVGVFLLSGIATYLAASAWLTTKSEGRLFGRLVQLLILVGLILAFVFHWFVMQQQRIQLEDLRRDIQAIRANQPAVGIPSSPPQPPPPAVEVPSPARGASAPK